MIFNLHHKQYILYSQYNMTTQFTKYKRIYASYAVISGLQFSEHDLCSPQVTFQLIQK